MNILKKNIIFDIVFHNVFTFIVFFGLLLPFSIMFVIGKLTYNLDGKSSNEPDLIIGYKKSHSGFNELYILNNDSFKIKCYEGLIKNLDKIEKGTYNIKNDTLYLLSSNIKEFNYDSISVKNNYYTILLNSK